jgi:hypothetical protein
MTDEMSHGGVTGSPSITGAFTRPAYEARLSVQLREATNDIVASMNDIHSHDREGLSGPPQPVDRPDPPTRHDRDTGT